MVDISRPTPPRPGAGPASAEARADAAATATAIRRAFDSGSYVEWSAVFAGAVIALAVSFVLLTFGAAVGLSAVSPWTSTRTTVTAVSIGAGFWLILVNVWAYALGGYLAGRMRHRRRNADPAEVAFRDGAHGAAVWGASIVMAAAIAALAASGSSPTVVSGNASNSANSDTVAYATDLLLRAPSGQPARAEAAARSEEVRGEIGRLLTRSAAARGDLAAADRTYLSALVAARTGLAAPAADQRVSEVVAQMKQTADRARKTAIVAGFIAAATLLLAAAAAWWAATIGGEHRDQGRIWHGLGRHVAHVPGGWSRPRSSMS